MPKELMIEETADKTEMERMRRVALAMSQITGATEAQIISKVARMAERLRMFDLEAGASRKVQGLLAGTVKLSIREWKIVLNSLVPDCRALLQNELAAKPQPSGLASVFNRQEKREREHRALILRACLDISCLGVDTIAPRVLHAGFLTGGEFEDVQEAQRMAEKAIAKQIRLSEAQWNAMAMAFVAAAVQGIDREVNAVENEHLNPEPLTRMAQDARILAGCNLIGGLNLQQAGRHAAKFGQSFGLDSLADGTEEKLREVLASACVLTNVERAAILTAPLKAAERALQDELAGTPSTAARFVEIVRGALTVSDLTFDTAAPMVERLAGRWFVGRLEKEAAPMLRRAVEDGDEFSPEERRIIAMALLARPLQIVRAELELCK